jgi:hypothetical protein
MKGNWIAPPAVKFIFLQNFRRQTALTDKIIPMQLTQFGVLILRFCVSVGAVFIATLATS